MPYELIKTSGAAPYDRCLVRIHVHVHCKGRELHVHVQCKGRELHVHCKGREVHVHVHV